ncbi:MAG: polyphosphate kinase 1 [Bacteroidales bacterium]|nr:polyphosphate kinase 1 [Bacteroidales bacterium]
MILSSDPKYKYIRNKEISWLAFNSRVLQEAENPKVPLIERLKFLGIYSNNLDEYYRVRVATLRRLSTLGKKNRKVFSNDPLEIIAEIQKRVLEQQGQFEKLYEILKAGLAEHYIHIIDESQLDTEQEQFVKKYFHEKLKPKLSPIFFKNDTDLSPLKDDEIYLAITLRDAKQKISYAIINIPAHELTRFVLLPAKEKHKHIILLDDVIRYGLTSIFGMFDFEILGAHTFKITRDAELDLNDDLSDSYLRKIAKGLVKRKVGYPVRFVYDSNMPKELIDMFNEKLSMSILDASIPGGRYHNFKDFIDFPNIGDISLINEEFVPVRNRFLKKGSRILDVIKHQDVLLHFPYQTFNHILDLLREAALDPKVISIKMTLYRLAHNSSIMKALINAAQNGKNVVAVMELQARFDEESNIYWTRKLSEAGVRVIPGVPGMKVHSKVLLIEKKAEKDIILFAGIGTGNYNESTAKIFSDTLLLTSNKGITKDIDSIFNFFDRNYNIGKYSHLLVSPFNLRSGLISLINQEIKNAKLGKKAIIRLKLNNLADAKIIYKLYEAQKAGVEVQLNIRGMFSLIPEIGELEVNIECIAIIDRYLEHSRIFYFYAGGIEKILIGSSDLMERNMDRRIEVLCPIYDKDHKEELMTLLNMQWKDNVSSRILDNKLSNQYKTTDSPEFRSQFEFYKYISNKHK